MILNNSLLLKYFNRICGTNIEAVSLGCIILCIGDKMDPRVERHELIHCEQWKDLLIMFPIVYFYDYVNGRLSGLGAEEAYRNTRAEREAYDNENVEDYLQHRTRLSWIW